MNLKVVVVDDEPPARERLRTLLAKEPGVELIAECESGPEALSILRQRRAVLLFLDVQMPGMNGFELLENMPGPWPAVIFVTAFNEHAVAAFDAQALDYLLKPFTPARFSAAVARARATLSSESQQAAARRMQSWLEVQLNPSSPITRIVARDRDRVRFINVSDIDWIESAGNYVVVHANREKHLLRESLTSLETQLATRDFFRINRRTLVRLAVIVELVTVERDDHVAVLATGERLPLTCGVREITARMVG